VSIVLSTNLIALKRINRGGNDAAVQAR
jgi:hypothetical protein